MSAEDKKDNVQNVAEAVDHYIATTVPVHIDIRSEQVVLSLAEATRILKAAKSIALGPCDCRKGKHKGDSPVETCLVLDEHADSEVSAAGAFRSVTVEEALDALDATHKAGFVHLAYRKPGEDATVFCSCCTCCCWFLNTLKQFSYRAAVVESSHIAQHDEEVCIGCGQCISRCPFEAWSLAEGDTKPTLDGGNCFGCGVCVTTCPVSAISFVPRT